MALGACSVAMMLKFMLATSALEQAWKPFTDCIQAQRHQRQMCTDFTYKARKSSQRARIDGVGGRRRQPVMAAAVGTSVGAFRRGRQSFGSSWQDSLQLPLHIDPVYLRCISTGEFRSATPTTNTQVWVWQIRFWFTEPPNMIALRSPNTKKQFHFLSLIYSNKSTSLHIN